jgi:hypothetical protein
VGTYPDDVVLADLNGDGKLDAAVSNVGGSTVSVLLGKGDGTFAAAVDWDAGDGPGAVAAGDLDGDGAVDLVVVTDQSASVRILHNDGHGQFTLGLPVLTEPSPPEGMPTLLGRVAAKDVDGDGRPDLVVGLYYAGGVAVLRNTGGGRFDLQTRYPTSWGPTSLALGDLNADGRIDIVTSSYSGAVSILWGVGDGPFVPGTSYASGVTLGPVAIVNYSGDARPEIVVNDYFTGLVILSQDPL